MLFGCVGSLGNVFLEKKDYRYTKKLYICNPKAIVFCDVNIADVRL